MVGVDTHFILLQVEGVLAGVDGFQLVVAVQVWPPPQAAVEDVRQAFTVGHLETPIQGPEQRVSPGQRKRKAACRRPSGCGDGGCPRVGYYTLRSAGAVPPAGRGRLLAGVCLQDVCIHLMWSG